MANANVITPEKLREQPVKVVRTDVPALAETLGVSPGELFRKVAEVRSAPVCGVGDVV